MTINEMRVEFKRLLRNGSAAVGKAEWQEAVGKLARKKSKGAEPTPEQWLEAAREAKVKCPHCRNGLYQWGASVNGVMTNSGPCFRCQGTGFQGQDDFTRNWGYDYHRRVA